MTPTFTAKGACVCGAVTLTTQSASPNAGACHCGTCRTWGGGPYLSTSCGTDVVFTGEEHISRYSSSNWAERGFCGLCGTHLFYRLKESGQHFVPCGVFGDTVPFELQRQVFIDEKPSFYTFSEETKEMTGAQIFALWRG